ncbi:hypothetical protein KEM56_003180 [Ascosphaera pollenicola]|nr:hypothetical protein KEM56_003180 [Ascosphaera pollenicola]
MEAEMEQGMQLWMFDGFKKFNFVQAPPRVTEKVAGSRKWSEDPEDMGGIALTLNDLLVPKRLSVTVLPSQSSLAAALIAAVQVQLAHRPD